MSTTPTETLFTCPNCKGYHFNIGVGGTLLCLNLGDMACKWRGRLPSEEPTKTIEPLPGLGSHKITIGATNTSPTTPQIQIRTAEQAREATEQAVRKEFQEELTIVSTSVELAIKLGKEETTLVRTVSSKASEFLTKAGYKVIHKTKLDGPEETTISW